MDRPQLAMTTPGVISAIGALVSFTTLTINNPAWTASGMSGLWNALKNFWGKGPQACVVFANGDSGCFQVNPMAPGASRVLANPVKDIDGNPIIVTDAITNSGGASLTVTNEISTGVVTYHPPGFLKPIVTCVRVNDGVQRCTVQPQ